MRIQLMKDALKEGFVPPFPLVDLHGHWGPFSGIYFPKPYGDGMIASMDRSKVILNVFSSHAALSEGFECNFVTLQAVREYPQRFRGYVVYNPNEPQNWERCRKLFEKHEEFVGFKIHPGAHNYPLSGKNYQPLFEYAHHSRALVLSHTWAGDICGTKAVEGIVEKYPEIRFLMGHSCYGEWEGAAQIARDYPHAYLELTAAYAVGGLVTYFVKQVGSEKMLFGTDAPWFDPYYPMGCIIFADISDEDRRNIFYRNAAKLLQIELGEER
ncbi:MAG: amidohydrolase family protein [Firmicutes bacterium]|jgi:predicted TIM-barrel fold metal-dependent hydrolase|nr:amidohydrolase family protein [Bacillota bacterium]